MRKTFSVDSFGRRRVSAAVVASVLCLPFSIMSAAGQVGADPLVPPTNGVRRSDSTSFALVRAVIHIAPGKSFGNAVLIIRDGKIISVTGTPIANEPAKPDPKPDPVPQAKPDTINEAKPEANPDAKPDENPAKPADDKVALTLTPLPAELLQLPVGRVIDCQGLHIYASFIEPFTEVDAPAPNPEAKATHWSEKVTPQRSALDGAGIDETTARQLRGMGFGAAAVSPKGGIFRGSASVVSLAKPGREVSMSRPLLFRRDVYQTIAMETAGGAGSEKWNSYPDSQMGSIALIRQTLLDADYEVAKLAAVPASSNDSAVDAVSSISALAALHRDAAKAASGPTLLLDSGNELETLRVLKIAREFNRPAIVLGSGLEFRRLDAITTALTGGQQGASTLPPVALIVPLNYPEKPKTASLGEIEALELRELMTWEQAPTNLRRLEQAGQKPILTTAKLKDRGKFMENLRTAIRAGVSEQAALAMLTTRPAELLGLAGTLGTLDQGKQASFIITDGPVFAKKTKFREIWIDGQRHELAPPPTKIEGTFGFTVDAALATEAGKPVTSIDGLELVIDKDGGITVRGPVPTAPKISDSAAKPDSPAKPDAPTPPEAGEKPAALPAATPAAVASPAPTGPTPDAPANLKPAVDAEVKPETATPDQKKPSTRKSDEPKRPTAKARNVQIGEGRVNFVFDHDAFGTPGVWSVSGLITTDPSGRITLTGSGITTGGSPLTWIADKKDAEKPAEGGDADGKDKKDVVPKDSAKEPSKDGAKDATKDATDKLPDETAPVDAAVGSWSLSASGPNIQAPMAVSLTVTKSDKTYFAAVIAMGQSAAVSEVTFDAASSTLNITSTEPPAKISLKLTGDTASGTVSGPNGEMQISGARTPGSGKASPEKNKDDDEKVDAPADLPGYPFGANAIKVQPPAEKVIFTNATVWTATASSKKGENGGIIDNGAVVLSDGQILFVGKTADLPKFGDEYRTVNLRGKHITPGIIDCHSHTGISGGVNEAGQAVTAEVRIADVTNPDVQSWYRQLAGGVTAVNNLHGSANPIGGQNQVNKIRWGCQAPDDMHMQGAAPGIKFALGENVKQSNGSDRGGWRYPQTRMGVETIIRDRFMAAREYAAAWETYNNSKPALTPVTASQVPRVDLELIALAEVLAGKRLVHCHSYRQDEILMLGRIAQEFGFKIGTFQHILEGYKVAEIVRDLSGGASGFSDWWAFKVEVQDAIPQAGPIMHEAGAVVSFNSDSDELARRMNVEAGKAVKYSSGSVSPHEALQFVTLNPARQLKIDARTGSLEAGKDADVVIWSGDPLSSFSLAEATYVDGVLRFSLEQNKQLSAQNQVHRTRILSKLLVSKKPEPNSGNTPKSGDAKPNDDTAPEAPSPDNPRRRRPTLLSQMWDDARALNASRNLDMLRRGIDPANSRRGECGCDQ